MVKKKYNWSSTPAAVVWRKKRREKQKLRNAVVQQFVKEGARLKDLDK